MKTLSYPFDSSYILKKKRSIKKELLASGSGRIKKKIAVLGGSTTNEIVNILELFLLDQGIEPEFYQSEYAQFWQDAVFGNEELSNFAPDIVYVHTTSRNLSLYDFNMSASEADINEMLENQYRHFEEVWTNVKEKFGCPVIQNNFELPFYRILGNKDATDIHGKISFIRRLNEKFAEYARTNENFYINDINFISSCYGLEQWHDTSAWYMYKYAMNTQAIPEFAYNLSNIIKSVFGKNRKMLMLDLDNTLWGGVVGDCGQQGIEIGHETGMAEGYTEFQRYVKAHKQLGVLLSVNSKNDYENAIDGLKHPDTVLTPDDFVVIKANWDNKDRNTEAIAEEISILPDSFVFVDDNPAERNIVSEQISGIAVPEVNSVEDYIKTIDRNGYFELTSYTADDIKRNEMYRANIQRAGAEKKFSDYGEYLKSLEMEAYIDKFDDVALARITQLTNKSNQFNLTTKRYTLNEMEDVFGDDKYIKIYGRLADKFGDNGIVSVVIGRKDGNELHIDLWLMSCRVLKREMEYAMLDRLVEICRKNGISVINGYYYKTAKNAMVKDLFTDFGFEMTSENENGDRTFRMNVDGYENKNKSINVTNNGGY